ncbi:MAG: cupin domain-containing protein [Clostridia bacterium]|nr:cupin domain-containing protein [Clostridia bacterium]
MNIILLSGGSGKRLWPLSNDIRSKQFIKILTREDGSKESMTQRVCRQMLETSPDTVITVATGKRQKSAVMNQVGDQVGVCIEPSRRDTFPAIALACAYMYSEKGLKPSDVVVVCPVDPYVDNAYFEALVRLEKAVVSGKANLTLMGVTPTYPSEKYGYIIPHPGDEPIRQVDAFREKPDEAAAKEYIRQGALWNCGVFAFRLGYVLNILHSYLEYDCYADVYAHYDLLPKISFDYAVVEKEKSINCIEYSGEWRDVGTWNTFSEVMSEPTIGQAILGDGCEDTNIINELDIPILAMGCKNMVIAAGPDGILVSTKPESASIKPHVDKLEKRVMYEEKSWGEYQVLYETKHSLTLRLSIMAGRSLSYHAHSNRNESWHILSGSGVVTVDGCERAVKPGDTIALPFGKPHKLVAMEDMEVLEIQYGSVIDDADKKKY